MLLFRALAKNMAPMTNADESPTNRLTFLTEHFSLYSIYSLTRCQNANAANATHLLWCEFMCKCFKRSQLKDIG